MKTKRFIKKLAKVITPGIIRTKLILERATIYQLIAPIKNDIFAKNGFFEGPYDYSRKFHEESDRFYDLHMRCAARILKLLKKQHENKD